MRQWKRGTRVGADFPRPYLVKSHHACALFFCPFTVSAAENWDIRRFATVDDSPSDSFHQRVTARPGR